MNQASNRMSVGRVVSRNFTTSQYHPGITIFESRAFLQHAQQHEGTPTKKKHYCLSKRKQQASNLDGTQRRFAVASQSISNTLFHSQPSSAIIDSQQSYQQSSINKHRTAVAEKALVSSFLPRKRMSCRLAFPSRLPPIPGTIRNRGVPSRDEHVEVRRNFCGILMSELRSVFLAQRNHNLRNCTETTFIALSRP
jgi:hypothetical protein